MVGFLSKKVEKRSFKYYPRYTKDDKQENKSPFATSYREKRADSDMEKDVSIKGKSFKFKRNLKIEKQKAFLGRMRTNFILIFALAALLYGVYWVLNNTDFFYSYGQQWTI